MDKRVQINLSLLDEEDVQSAKILKDHKINLSNFLRKCMNKKAREILGGQNE